MDLPARKPNWLSVRIELLSRYSQVRTYHAFQLLLTNRVNTYWTVIQWIVLGTFFVNWGYNGYFPAVWHHSLLNRLVEYNGQGFRKLRSTRFKKHRMDAIWTHGRMFIYLG